MPFVRDSFRLGFLDPLALVEATPTFYEYPNCDRDPLPRWSFGGVTLLGDAAHPMYPTGSNGASQSIVDAQSLARCLVATPSVAEALAAYDARAPTGNRQGRGGQPRRRARGRDDVIEERGPDEFDDIDAIASHAGVRRSCAAMRRWPAIAGAGEPAARRQAAPSIGHARVSTPMLALHERRRPAVEGQKDIGPAMKQSLQGARH